MEILEKVKLRDVGGNRAAVTDSLVIAEVFDKRHDHILRSIYGFEKDVPNFGEMYYLDSDTDSYGRMRKLFYMTKDGFMLLVMGFTGKKALQLKLEYIKEFNRMENLLRTSQSPFFESNTTSLMSKLIEVLSENNSLLKENFKLKNVHERESVNMLSGNNSILKQEIMSIFSDKDVVAPRALSKIIGISSREFNRILKNLGVLQNIRTINAYKKEVSAWTTTPKFSYLKDDGYVVERYCQNGKQLFYTKKGAEFVLNLLKQKGAV